MDKNYTINFKNGHMIDLFGDPKSFKIGYNFVELNNKKIAQTRKVDYIIEATKYDSKVIFENK